MKVLSTLSELGQVRRGGVLTIGNFDGLHLGHREIFRTARCIARRRDAEMVVMTFEPHPVAVLHPEKAPGVLTPLPLKLHLLQEYADDCIRVTINIIRNICRVHRIPADIDHAGMPGSHSLHGFNFREQVGEDKADGVVALFSKTVCQE